MALRSEPPTNPRSAWLRQRSQTRPIAGKPPPRSALHFHGHVARLSEPPRRPWERLPMGHSEEDGLPPYPPAVDALDPSHILLRFGKRRNPAIGFYRRLAGIVRCQSQLCISAVSLQ